MSKKENDALLGGIGDDTMRDIKALASTREGQQLRKELSGIDSKKLLETFSKMDKETIKARLKNINADTLKKAMENKDFLDKLK